VSESVTAEPSAVQQASAGSSAHNPATELIPKPHTLADRANALLIAATHRWKALPRRTQAVAGAGAAVLILVILIVLAMAAAGSEPEPGKAFEAPARAAPAKPAAGPSPASDDVRGGASEVATAGAQQRTDVSVADKQPTLPEHSLPDVAELTTLPLSFERATEAYTVSDPEKLGQIVQALRAAVAENGLRVQIGGHASIEGNSRFNLEIAGRRAAMVRKYLRDQGIPRDKLRLKNYGTSLPLNPEARHGERHENRRVTVRVIP
jgi:outer membrane protein OmpA-like peptidoglycan-associated protein